MDYLELLETQERIVAYHQELKDRISYIDSNGNRKLDRYYFLSAEVAAYKLLDLWMKAMNRGQDNIDDEARDLLALIERVLMEDYEDFETYETDLSMPLWSYLSEGFESDALHNFNLEVFLVASLAEMAKGTRAEDCLFVTTNDADLKDPNFISYAYSLAHDYLITFSNERLEEFAAKGFGICPANGELYKFHFNLFQ